MRVGCECSAHAGLPFVAILLEKKPICWAHGISWDGVTLTLSDKAQ